MIKMLWSFHHWPKRCWMRNREWWGASSSLPLARSEQSPNLDIVLCRHPHPHPLKWTLRSGETRGEEKISVHGVMLDWLHQTSFFTKHAWPYSRSLLFFLSFSRYRCRDEPLNFFFFVQILLSKFIRIEWFLSPSRQGLSEKPLFSPFLSPCVQSSATSLRLIRWVDSLAVGLIFYVQYHSHQWRSAWLEPKYIEWVIRVKTCPSLNLILY